MFRLSLKQSYGKKHFIVFDARATTTQLYPGRDTFDQGHVTKNQPITLLVLLSV